MKVEDKLKMKNAHKRNSDREKIVMLQELDTKINVVKVSAGDESQFMITLSSDI